MPSFAIVVSARGVTSSTATSLSYSGAPMPLSHAAVSAGTARLEIAADLIWPRLGDVPNYVEPFAGSLAVMLARPTEPKTETVNDMDCYIANFWRALCYAPDIVTEFADEPVNEADLHARHMWLVNQEEFRERMKIDPDFYDPKIADGPMIRLLNERVVGVGSLYLDRWWLV